MQACRFGIKIQKARRHACQLALGTVDILDFFNRADRDISDMMELLGMALLHDIKNAFFRRIHNGIDILFALIAQLRNISGSANQTAQNGFFLHDCRIMAHIDGAADCRRKICQKRQTAYLFKLPFFLQLILDCNHINGRAGTI